MNTNYGYDNMSNLLSVAHQNGAATLDGATYTYDFASNRTGKTNLLNSATSNLGYDNAYQLTGVTGANPESYTYDPVGNRLSSQLAATYSYNSSNEVTAAGTANYTYDDNGNTVTKTDATGTTAYTWDFENRLVSVQLPNSSTVNFKYDPFGRRIEKGTSVFAYEGANLIEESDPSGNVVARYAFGARIDEPLAAYRGSASAFYNADGLGSITSLTGLSGIVSDSFTYDSFGNVAGTTGSFIQPFRYTGREYDTETGLDYYRARYYDASVGRFLSEDPNKDGVAGSLYMYVENSPIGWSDPSGLQSPGLVQGPKTTPQQVSQFNAGMAEALNRLKNSDCRKLFCQKNHNLDPAKAVQNTEYRILVLPKSSAGAATMSPTSVFLDPNGPFFQTSTEVFIPYDNSQLTGKRSVKFDSLAELDAFILLHELGHQVGIFSADLFAWINGRHSLRVLDACFKKGAKVDY